MVNTFQNSFTRGQTREGGSATSSLRPNLIAGSNMDDVLRHYVRPPVQVMSTGQQSTNGHPIPANGAVDANLFKTISDRRDIRNILAMNPNAQLAIDIVVNGTLSPNNTLDSSLQYKSSYDKLGALKSTLLQKIQFIMNEYVELEDTLPTILRDAKYDVGSYAMLVIPMGNVKKFINDDQVRERNASNASGRIVKMESVLNGLADKANTKKLSTKIFEPQVEVIKFEQIGFKAEEFEDKQIPEAPPILVHSDLDVVRLGAIREKLIRMEQEHDCLADLEGLSGYDPSQDETDEEKAAKGLKTEALTDAIIDSSLDRARAYSMDDVIHLEPTEDAESSDLPLYKHVPHEAIFVVHRPGSPDKHEGYFIVMDMTGNPVSVDDELDIYMPTYSGVYGNSATESAMAGQANFAGGNLELGYSGFASNSMMGRRLSDKSALFTKLMDGKIKKLLHNGYFKTRDLTISKKNELMDIMFSRLCSNKQTQMVYVPATLLTYVAFDYDDSGNGQSLIIKHKNIGVLNSILTLANTLAAVNNTIDYKKIRVGFDDDEIDFNKVVEGVAGNLSRYTTLNASRLMNTDVNTQIDYLGHAGYQWEFEQHPHFPSTNVSIEHLDRERTMPDADTVEKNEAMLIQSLGSTPEVVDMARNVEFASSYFQSNLQAARRAIADQKILTKFLDKFIKSYVLNAPVVLKWMIQTIDKKRSEIPEIRGRKTVDIVREFVKSLSVELPRPDMVKVELLDQAITAQEKLVDHILKYTIGEEALEGEDVGENLEATLAAYRRKLKALIMREWMANNNMFNDGLISGLYTGDQEEVDNTIERIESQQKFIIDILKKHKIVTGQVIKKANDEVQKVEEAQGITDGGGSSFSNDDTSSNEGTGSEGESDPFGGDSGMGDGTQQANDNNEGGEPDTGNDPFA